MRAIAYFLTWTCHGTWLHGDERGSVDSDNNRLGRARLAPDTGRLNAEQALLADAVRTLTRDARRVVDDTIRQHCTIRRWQIRALNVRTNHVHVVVSCHDDVSPERVMDQLKAWSTRRLREAGLAGKDSRVWTEHGSTRWINSEIGLQEAIDYVLNGQ